MLNPKWVLFASWNLHFEAKRPQIVEPFDGHLSERRIPIETLYIFVSMFFFGQLFKQVVRQRWTINDGKFGALAMAVALALAGGGRGGASSYFTGGSILSNAREKIWYAHFGLPSRVE